jgi:hypothetical protein
MTSIRCVGLPNAASNGPSPGQAHDPGSGPELVGRTGAPATGRALVPTTPSPPGGAVPPGGRASANFLTQLIAGAQHLAQTRARRRAEPDDASAAYAAAVARCIDVGGTVCRSMWA